MIFSHPQVVFTATRLRYSMNENLLHNTNSSLKRDLDKMLRSELGTRITFSPIEEIGIISQDDFAEKYVRAQKPVLIKGGASTWPALTRWNFDFFGQTYGDVEVVANLYDVSSKKKMNFRQLASVLSEKQFSLPTYLQEWWFQENCKELLTDITVPNYFADDYNKKLLGFHNNTLWIGQKGAFTPVHQDTTFANVWSAQIMGSKEWILIDKSAVILANSEGKPDYDAFFAESKSMILKTVLEKGDILYIPHKWWHRAETLENAISLNTFYITEDIVQKYIRDVLSIPFSALLNKDLLLQYDPMRYNICMQRSEILIKMLGFDPKNILGIDTSGAATQGIYDRKAS
jgi:Cupin-like domain